MANLNVAELDTAIDRLQATVAVLKFVEQRLPERGRDADLAALNGLRVARERLVSLASELTSFVRAERQGETRDAPYVSAEAAAVPAGEATQEGGAEMKAADAKAA